MSLSGNKKIIMLGLILLILAGIIIVALKGINVDLIMGHHKSLNIVIGKEFELKDIQSICDEVFNDKKVALRKVEVFEDAVNINVVSITDEEKSNLVSKINEKYSLELDSNQIVVNSNSNVRVRDVVRPYIFPLGMSLVLIYIYIAVRYRKLNFLKVLGVISAWMLITEAVILSIIAICRIPLSSIIVNLMVVVAIVEIIIYISKNEKELVEIKIEDNTKKK